MNPFDYMTPGELAEKLGVPAIAVYKWIERGRLKAERRANRLWISAAAVKEAKLSSTPQS